MRRAASARVAPAAHILSVGTLVPRKGHDVLLRALARLFDLDWHLTIAGSPRRDPAHAAALVALAEELGIAHRVRFAGEVTGDALEALWRGADLFALATWFEGYGMVVAEALKRGLPVAVCSGGAAARWWRRRLGVVCEPGDQRATVEGAAAADLQSLAPRRDGRGGVADRPEAATLEDASGAARRQPLPLMRARLRPSYSASRACRSRHRHGRREDL